MIEEYFRERKPLVLYFYFKKEFGMLEEHRKRVEQSNNTVDYRVKGETRGRRNIRRLVIQVKNKEKIE